MYSNKNLSWLLGAENDELIPKLKNLEWSKQFWKKKKKNIAGWLTLSDIWTYYKATVIQSVETLT